MSQLPKCDLAASTVVLRSNSWGHAYRLTEKSPSFDHTPVSIHEIIKWLGVEKGDRWKPKPGSTYCNVYATDFAHACGVYLPRVWWNSSSESKLSSGMQVSPTYNGTVIELSANALFRWLSGPHSSTFGWRRVFSFTEAQSAADIGIPVVICARKKSEASPGHIAVIAPESDVVKPVRNASGEVVLPVLSQAGAKNEELGVASAWWTSSDMAEWGMWICDSA